MSSQVYYGNILVVANECFADNSSNGRTLKNMLGEIGSDRLAQFYIHGTPDRTFCGKYYQVSDQDAVNSMLPWRKRAIFRKANPENIESTETRDADLGRQQANTRKIVKNCQNRYLRDLVWRTYCWWNRDFDAFLNSVQPSVVLLQAGDMPVMFDIAVKIAKRYSASLLMYNSEGYVLKELLYNGARKDDPWHTLLQRRLKKAYARFMSRADYCIYSTEYLEESYQKKYPHSGKSVALYTVSELKPLQNVRSQERFELLYCGNLGVGRAVALDTVAKSLYKVDESAVLSIYGRFVSEQEQKMVLENPNVRYCGVVPYEQIPGLMEQASMLLHCENHKRVINLKYAFSTKIADCLASGRPFLVFADQEFPFVTYLKKNECCHVATSNLELQETLRKCIADMEFRERYHQAAIDTAYRNHNKAVNRQKVSVILQGLSK